MIDMAEQRSLADRRSDATREGIVEAAWRLSRQEGLTGWSLRRLADEVGLAAPSLYAYFDSKHAIYDVMFRQGYEQLDDIASRWGPAPGEPHRRAFKVAAAGFMEFCTSDPTRYQLMFQRVIPEFVPSADAYSASVANYERFRALLGELGVTDDRELDLWTAISTGLTDQQISNDPGGQRWFRLLDRAVDIFCDHVGIPPEPEGQP